VHLVQLMFSELQDVEGALARLPKAADSAAAELRAAPIRRQLDAAAAAVNAVRNGSAYRWVSLQEVCC
jgi:hypothetical protein